MVVITKGDLQNEVAVIVDIIDEKKVCEKNGRDGGGEGGEGGGGGGFSSYHQNKGFGCLFYVLKY